MGSHGRTGATGCCSGASPSWSSAAPRCPSRWFATKPNGEPARRRRYRTTVTGTEARLTTCSAVLPIRTSAGPPPTAAPMTIWSVLVSLTAATIVCAGEPTAVSISIVAVPPSTLSRASERSSVATARCSSSHSSVSGGCRSPSASGVGLERVDRVEQYDPGVRNGLECVLECGLCVGRSVVWNENRSGHLVSALAGNQGKAASEYGYRWYAVTREEQSARAEEGITLRRRQSLRERSERGRCRSRRGPPYSPSKGAAIPDRPDRPENDQFDIPLVGVVDDRSWAGRPRRTAPVTSGVVVGSGRDNLSTSRSLARSRSDTKCGVEPHRIRRDVDDREDVDDRVGSVSEDNARSSAAEAASLPSIGDEDRSRGPVIVFRRHCISAYLTMTTGIGDRRTTFAATASERRPPAVDRDVRPGDVRRLVRGEENDAMGAISSGWPWRSIGVRCLSKL